MSVSVVIPVKDDDRLFDCLEALTSTTGAGAELDIIVVDNGSAPEFRKRLGKMLPRIEVLDEARPGAFAARNRGVDAATGDIILFTDADCIPEPDWVAQAVDALEATGADIIQGFSGTKAPPDTVGDLIQDRYGARFTRLITGAPTECDTRNMAVRREVFEKLRFNTDFRRVGDTEFGLVAESLGYRVGYSPAMRVDHEHDDQLDTFVAKQICHGWGAQRIAFEYPGVPWHGVLLRLWARRMGWIFRVPGRRLVANALARLAVGGARVLQSRRKRLPGGVVRAAFYGLDKLGLLGGHLMYERYGREPAPSDFLGRSLERE